MSSPPQMRRSPGGSDGPGGGRRGPDGAKTPYPWDRPEAILALVAGVASVAGSFALAGFTPGFVVVPVESALTRLMPGSIVTFAILTLGGLGQTLNFLFAAVVTVLLLSGVVGLTRLAATRAGAHLAQVTVPAAATFGVTLLLTGALPSSLGAAAGAGLALVAAEVLARRVEDPEGLEEVRSLARRRLLGAVAGSASLGIASYLLGSQINPGDDPGPGSGSPDDPVTLAGVDGDAIRGLIDRADRADLQLAGMDGLVSRSFYEVDIDAVNPTVRTATWSLSVTGDVAESYELGYEDLREMPHEHRFETLRCVGERLNGHKMDTAVWTGVPAADLLERADPQGEYVVLRAADGYWEEFPLEALESGLITFGMNGSPLPRKHGYPVRALVPGHWGEINVKWLTEIEVSDEPVVGYWERRGWHGTGPVKTVAKIHAVDRLEDGRVEVGGHTYAGTRGIEAVEVSTDGGETWTEAELSEKLPGEDVWRQWVHRYEHPGQEHEVVARAIDGTGTTQPRERESPFPSGPGGWVRETIE